MPADQLNLDAFMTQAMEYENWDDPSDRVRRFFYEIGQTHPYAVRRVSEVMKWVQSGEYDRILRGEYRTPRRGPTDVREEAGDAIEFYAERFRAIFREIGDNVTNARHPGRRRRPSRSPTGSAPAAARRRRAADPRTARARRGPRLGLAGRRRVRRRARRRGVAGPAGATAATAAVDARSSGRTCARLRSSPWLRACPRRTPRPQPDAAPLPTCPRNASPPRLRLTPTQFAIYRYCIE